jgi:hypothetical protein
MSFSFEPPSSMDGTSGESQLSFSGSDSAASVANNLEQTLVPADGNTETCADTSPGCTAIVFGEGSGEKMMSTTGTATAPKDEIDLSAPSSLAEMNRDVLGQILGYAQPPEHHLRFEWLGSVGRTCKIFHELSHEDSEYNRGVSLDISEFEAYMSIFPATTRPRDIRLAFLQRLVEDESMRARVAELHFQRNEEVYYREAALSDYFPVEAHNSLSFGGSPTMTFLEHSKAIVDSLIALLSRPNSLPKLRVLDIHQKLTHDLVEFELFNNELLLALPKALPKLDHLCLSNCFFSSCHSCVNSPLGHRPCAMTDISVDQLVEFATSLKTPLRSLSIGRAPWMSDVHVSALLSVVGKDLRVLELIDCGRLHFIPDPRDLTVEGTASAEDFHEITPISARSLEAVAEHCVQLRILRVLSNLGVYTSNLEDWDVALEAVLRANPRLHANDGIKYYSLKFHNLVSAIKRRIFNSANTGGFDDEFEPTEGSKYAELTPFASRLSSSIVSCRNDPARVARILETAVEAAERAYLQVPVLAARMDMPYAVREDEFQMATVAALDAALAEI